jgi:Ca2+-transporting ATPase
VPADCRVLKLASSTLSLDEGSLTGESVTTPKAPDVVAAAVPIQGKANLVFSGSMVTVGSALGVVVATGMATEMGAISKGVAAARMDEVKTPLGQKLDEFGGQVTERAGRAESRVPISFIFPLSVVSLVSELAERFC